MSPSLPLRQLVWDNAARSAARGLSLPAITEQVLTEIRPRLQDEVIALVPGHGRAFRVSLAKAMVWALAIDALLVLFGPGIAGSVPYLQPILLVVVLVWALAFGVMAGHQRVRSRRTEVGHGIVCAVEVLAEKAAFRVWAAEVPGRWQPLGPAPSPTAPSVAPADWLRRLGLDGAAAAPVELDGLDPDAGRALRTAAARGDRPVIGFVREPGFFDDDTRTLADDFGIALFVLGSAGLVPMSATATAVLTAYADRRGGGISPADAVRNGWSGSAAARSVAP